MTIAIAGVAGIVLLAVILVGSFIAFRNDEPIASSTPPATDSQEGLAANRPDGRSEAAPIVQEAESPPEDSPLQDATEAVVQMSTPNIEKRLVVTGLVPSPGDQRWNQAEGWENAIGEIGQLDTGRGVDLLEWSPNGKYALIGQAADFSVWDMESWHCLYEYADTDVVCLAFATDGETLLSGFNNGNIVAWDMKTGQETLVVQTGAAAIRRLVHSPTKPLAVTYDSDGHLRLWDLAARKTLRTFGEGAMQVLDLAFTANGTGVVVLKRDGESASLATWDIDTGNLLTQRPDIPEGRLSPQGQYLLSPTYRSGKVRALDLQQTRVIDVATGQEVCRLGFLTSPFRSFRFSPDGLWVATGHPRGEVVLHDTATGCLTLRFKVDTYDQVQTLALSPDRRRILFAGSASTVRLWQLPERASVGKEPLPESDTIVQLGGENGPRPGKPALTEACFAPLGDLVLTANSRGSSADTTYYLWQTTSGRLLRCYGQRHGAALVGDGKTLLLVGNQELAACDTLTGRLRKGKQPEQGTGFPFGRRVLLPPDDGLAAWDAEQGSFVYKAGMCGSHAVLSLDGMHLASAENPRSIMRVDLDTQPQHMQSYWGHADDINCLTFSSDGRFLISGNADGKVRIFSAVVRQQSQVDRPLYDFDATNPLSSLASSPDGKILACGDQSGTISLWGLSSRKEADRFRAHESTIVKLAFSPDGERLFSAASEGEIGIWTIPGVAVQRNPQIVQADLAWVTSTAKWAEPVGETPLDNTLASQQPDSSSRSDGLSPTEMTGLAGNPEQSADARFDEIPMAERLKIRSEIQRMLSLFDNPTVRDNEQSAMIGQLILMAQMIGHAADMPPIPSDAVGESAEMRKLQRALPVLKEELVTPLKKHTSHRSPSLRFCAALMIAMISPDDARGYTRLLEMGLRRPEPIVQEMAVLALNRVDPTAADRACAGNKAFQDLLFSCRAEMAHQRSTDKVHTKSQHEPSPIVGTWKNEQRGETLHFAADGTGSLDSARGKEALAWVLVGESFSVMHQTNGWRERLSIEDGVLHRHDVLVRGTVPYRRADEAILSEPRQLDEKAIVGAWGNKELNEVYNFMADGTGSRQSPAEGDRAFQWKPVGESVKTIYLLPSGGPSNYGDTFSLEDGVLVRRGGVRYTRQATTKSGPDASAFVGHWVDYFEEQPEDSGFELRADGTGELRFGHEQLRWRLIGAIIRVDHVDDHGNVRGWMGYYKLGPLGKQLIGCTEQEGSPVDMSRHKYVRYNGK